MTPAAFRKLRREIKCFTKRTSFMFQTNFYGTVSLPLCRILCFKLTTEPPKEQAQRWSFCITVFFISMTFYEFSHKSAQKAGCCFLPQAYSTRPFVLGGIVPLRISSCQIALYWRRNFSRSVPSIFFSASFRAMRPIRGSSMSVSFRPSRSFTEASTSARTS